MEPTLQSILRRVVVLGNWAYGPAISISGLLGLSTLLDFFLSFFFFFFMSTQEGMRYSN